MKPEIHAEIGRMITDAQNSDTASRRAALFDRYMGEPYGDETKNRSKFVSTDVADAVEAVLPDLMDVFTSAEDIVEFAPVGPEDEAAARQETAVVSHVFWQLNPGFENLYTWIKEALIQQNSYVQRGWDDREWVTIEEYDDMTLEDAILALDGKDYEVIETEENEDGTFYLKVRCTEREKKYVIECFPQEEFFVTPQWNKVSLEGAPCCGRRRNIERGELLRMGFSKESVEEATLHTQEAQTDDRHSTQDLFEGEAGAGDAATEEVTIYQSYCRVDINDDKKAETVRVWSTGDGSKVMKWANGKDAIDEISGVPFSALTPYIIPHRHVGRGLAELIDDIARVKTVLIRHSLDNLYATNYARPHFDENNAGQNTYADLMNPAPGAAVRTGGAVIDYPVPPQVIGTTLPLIDKMDDIKEVRTGATRYNQGLDAESLNKTARGIEKIMNASQKKTLLIARVIAETGLRDLFMGIHRDLRTGPMRELAVSLTNGWVKVDPKSWKRRSDMTVKVGMGSGDRDMRRQGLMLMAQTQEKLLSAGAGLVDMANVYNLSQEVMATFGFKSIDKFMKHPTQVPPPQPPAPDPQMMIAQKQLQVMENESVARIQLDAQKARDEHERKMMEIRIRQQDSDVKAQKAASDIMTDHETLELDRKRTVMADDLARDQMKTTEQPAIDYGAV